MKSPYSGMPMWAITRASRGCRRSSAADGLGGTGVFARRGSGSAVDDHGCAGVLEHAPHAVEQWIVRVVVADLDVRLEDSGAAIDRGGDVVGGAGLRVERRGGQGSPGGQANCASPTG